MQLLFTVDVDRDAAWPQNGSMKARSKHSAEPSFEASRKGFVALVDLLNDLRLPATFFFEASTALQLGKTSLKGHEVACHGLDHEDFAGEFTGKPLSVEERQHVLKTAKKLIEDRFSREVQGFRAPYLHWDKSLLELLPLFGFSYDSSVVKGELAAPPLSEVFLPSWRDARGLKMSGYLWPLMEGKRQVDEYVQAVATTEAHGEPYVVLATHSWHTHCSVSGVLSEKQVRNNVAKLRELLEKLSDSYDFSLCKKVVGV